MKPSPSRRILFTPVLAVAVAIPAQRAAADETAAPEETATSAPAPVAEAAAANVPEPGAPGDGQGALLHTSVTDAPAPVPLAPPAAKAPEKKPSQWDNVKLGTVWYLSSSTGESGGADFSNARITRGYVTLKYRMADWLEPRVTMDTHQVDSGDYVVRLKYMYAKLKHKMETKFLTDPNVEIGLVHGPWFDYEEHINNYRAQGKMFIERVGILNSADAGVTFAGLLGEKLPKDYQKKVSKKYPGTFGSFAFGLYNGGGYHGVENNTNKVFESRLSVRPVGPILPNLQLSHFFVHGKTNTAAELDWRLNAVMASFEHQYFVATTTWAKGTGDQKGKYTDATDTTPATKSLDWDGLSAFGEIKIPAIKTSIIGRLDRWEWEGKETEMRTIVGVAYHFLPHNFVLLDLDRHTYDDDTTPTAWELKATMQIHYP